MPHLRSRRIEALLAKVRQLLPRLRLISKSLFPRAPRIIAQKRKAARNERLFYALFDVNPSVATPIPMSFVLAPPVAIAIALRPLPIVAINTQLHFGRINRPLSKVPAVAVFVAYDLG